MRPGYGRRHPGLTEVLASSTPVLRTESPWARTSAYLGTAALPDILVTSVRCLVQVNGQVVVCTNADGISHPWPGGRRQQGESFADTAGREVHEETGWLLDRDSLRQLGWLHLEYSSPVPDDHPFPHPDFCQVVLAGRAAERDSGPAAAWTDTDGYELGSQLMTVDDAWQAVSGDPASRAYLRLLAT